MDSGGLARACSCETGGILGGSRLRGIGGNHGGTPEVIDDGETGYLVEHGDLGRLTHLLINLSDNPELRRTMGANGYKKLRANYVFPRMRDNWFSVLDEAICS